MQDVFNGMNNIIKVYAKMIKKREKENIFIRMAHTFKVILSIIVNTEKEFYILKMEII